MAFALPDFLRPKPPPIHPPYTAPSGIAPFGVPSQFAAGATGGIRGGGTATGGGGGGSGVDYAALLASDPFLQQANANYAAAGVQDAASRAAARQRAIVQFGEIPDFAKMAGALGLVGGNFQEDLAGPYAQLANENTAAGLSTKARLDLAHQDNVRSLVNVLASRGMLHSGDTGFGLNREDLNFAQGGYDARQKLLDYLGNVNNSYLNAESARQAALANAQSQAMQNLLDMIRAGLFGGDSGGGGGGDTGSTWNDYFPSYAWTGQPGTYQGGATNPSYGTSATYPGVPINPATGLPSRDFPNMTQTPGYVSNPIASAPTVVAPRPPVATAPRPPVIVRKPMRRTAPGRRSIGGRI